MLQFINITKKVQAEQKLTKKNIAVNRWGHELALKEQKKKQLWNWSPLLPL